MRPPCREIRSGSPGAPSVSRRHAPGLTPTIAENTRVKWLWLAKPAEIAISDNGRSRTLINCLAAFTRWCRKPPMRRQAGGDAKCARKVADRQIELGCDGSATRACRRGRTRACRRRASPATEQRPPRPGSAPAPESTIGLRDVGGQRKHHVVDEKLVGFVRPAQCCAANDAPIWRTIASSWPTSATVEVVDARRA